MRTEALCQQKICIFVKLFFHGQPDSLSEVVGSAWLATVRAFYSRMTSTLRPEHHVGLEVAVQVRAGGQDAHAIGLTPALPGHKVAGID